MAGIESFPPEVCAKLKYYVYRLDDPRNGKTFYVGKGQNNRVFEHVRGELRSGDNDADESNKMKRIREIREAGLEVGHIIHRHGMDEKTALEVEAALIDLLPEISNAVAGNDNNDHGKMHALEIIMRYAAETAVISHRAILINVARVDDQVLQKIANGSPDGQSLLLEAIRYAWKIDPARAKNAEVVLATQKGKIVGVFIADEWKEATTANFPGRDPAPGRFGFEGKEAPEDMQKLYLRKRVPEEYLKPGAANPIKYTW